MSEASTSKPAPVSRTAAIGQSLSDYLQKTARLIKAVDLGIAILRFVIAVCCFLMVGILIDHWVWPLNVSMRFAIWFALLGASTWWMITRVVPIAVRTIHPAYAAKRIEHVLPELKNSLINWLQLSDESSETPRGVLAAVGRHATTQLKDHDAGNLVDHAGPIRLAAYFVGIMVVFAVYLALAPKSGFDSLQRLLIPWKSLASPSRVVILEVTPGNATVTQGTSLPVHVQLRGLHKDETASLRYETLDGQLVDQRVPMEAEIEGLSYRTEFGKTFGGIQQALRYWVVAGDAEKGPFQVQVQSVPLLVVDRVEYVYPAYMKLKNRTVRDDGRIEAPEGTLVTIHGSANQPMVKSHIEFNPVMEDGRFVRASSLLDIEVAQKDVQGKWYLQLDDKRTNPTIGTYRVVAKNAIGESNLEPVIHPMKVLADLAPEIRIPTDHPTPWSIPGESVTQIPVRTVDPDFGLTKITVSALRDGRSIFEATLLESADGIEGPVEKIAELKPSDWELRPGDQFELVFEARDNRHRPGTSDLDPNITKTRPILMTVAAPPKEEPQNPKANPKSEPNKKDPKKQDPKNPNRPNKNDNPNTDNNNQNGENPNKEEGPKKGPKNDKGNQANNQNSKKPNSTEKKPPKKQQDPANDQQEQSQKEQGQQGSEQGGSESSSGGSKQKGSSSSGSSSGSSSNEGTGESGEDQAEGQEGSGSGESTSNGNNSPTGKPSNKSQSKPEAGGSSGDQSEPENGEGSSIPEDGKAFQDIKDYMDKNSRNSDSTEPRNGNENGTTSNEQNGTSNQNGVNQDSLNSNARNPDESGTSDKAAGDKAAGDKAAGDKAAGDKAAGDKAAGDKAAGDKATGDKAAGDKAAGDKATGDKAAGDKAAGDKAAGDKAAGDKATGDKATGDKAAGDKATGDKATGDKAAGDKAAGDKAAGDKAAGDKGAGDKGAGDKGAGDKGAGDKGAGDKGAGDKGAGDKGTGDKGTGDKGTGDKGTGDKGTGDKGAGDKGAGDKGAGDKGAGDKGAGDKGAGDKGAGDKTAGDKTAGDKAAGDKGAGDKGAGDKSAGDKGAGDKGAGDKGAGDKGAGDKGAGDKGAGDKGAGDKGAGDKGAGDKGAGDKGAGDKGAGDKGAGDKGAGDKGAGDKSAGDKGAGDKGAGDKGASDKGAGDKGAGDKGAGDKGAGDKGAGDKTAGDKAAGDKGAGDKGAGDKSAGDKGAGDKGAGDKGAAGNAKGPAGKGKGSDKGNPSGESNRTESSDEANEETADIQSEEANEEYARKATDMVLDYLDRQKDQPDPELLKKLDWTKDDFREFLERWKNAKEQAAKDPKKKSELDEALRSLGLTPNKNRTARSTAPVDSMNGIQEKGTRVRPPEALRENFEAYKNALKRGRGN